MSTLIKLGIIREEKIPQDHRVPLIPIHCQLLLAINPDLCIYVQPSSHRAFTESEYIHAGCSIAEDLSDCDILMGVKEVPIDKLIAGKTYLFFSHTIKKQIYNQGLMQALLAKKIRMIDYEVITFDNGKRAVAFGHYAGIVGAHNGLLAYGKRTGKYHVKPAHQCIDYAELRSLYTGLALPAMKIIVTGTGRVGGGTVELLHVAGLRQVSKEEFIHEPTTEPVYCVLRTKDLYARKQDGGFDREEFHQYPERYICNFAPYYQHADVMMNTIFWDPKAPVFFSNAEMASPNFKIQTIADITCDIAGSIPATIRASTIAQPTYGFNPHTGLETAPFEAHVIDIMAVDNLPCELPRDASTEFSHNLIKHVMQPLLNRESESAMIKRATITEYGDLGQGFSYLADYAGIEERGGFTD